MINWIEKDKAKCTESIIQNYSPFFLLDKLHPNTFQLLKTTALEMQLIKWSDQFEVKLSEKSQKPKLSMFD